MGFGMWRCQTFRSLRGHRACAASLGVRAAVLGLFSVDVACGDAGGRLLSTARSRDTAGGGSTASPLGQTAAASRLLFACVGDTRPPLEDDTADYPTAVISRIFEQIEGLRPHPPFAIATGDYVFASEHSATAAVAQFDLYLQARMGYSGALFPAMGNHECTGATTSNCGPEGMSGQNPNYNAFLQKMLAPIGQSQPYYAVRVDSAPGATKAWTAKFVVVAANAWSAAQESWLESALAQPTTYTFVIRHEPAAANTAPGVTPSEAVMARHPYTLSIVGHTHTYRHSADTPREVVIGNGGAPLVAKDYGFGLFTQQSDGTIAVDVLNWQTALPDPQFHFAVKADGSAAP